MDIGFAHTVKTKIKRNQTMRVRKIRKESCLGLFGFENVRRG
jgi:hypothetical protein